MYECVGSFGYSVYKSIVFRNGKLVNNCSMIKRIYLNNLIICNNKIMFLYVVCRGRHGAVVSASDS